MYLAGIIRQDGVIDGRLAGAQRAHPAGRPDVLLRLLHGADGRAPLRITQNDVRAIQLAKAALYAGVRLLMERMGVERVDRIRLAGAFGSHIDVKYAMVLGMIPDCDLDGVSSAGNAAGTGARIALLDQRARGDDRGARAPRREDRDRRRAALPGALRRGDGDPAPDGAVPAAPPDGDAAGAQGDGERRRTPQARQGERLGVRQRGLTPFT